MDRRRLLAGAAAGGALAAIGPVRAMARTTGAQDASAAFNALMDRIAQEMLLSDPESLTMLGMDRGPMADARFKLSDRSQAKVEADKAKFVAAMKDMAAIDRNALPAKEQVYHDSLTFFGETVMQGYAFPTAAACSPRPIRSANWAGPISRSPTSSTASIASRRRTTPRPICRACRTWPVVWMTNVSGCRSTTPPGPFRRTSS